MTTRAPAVGEKRVPFGWPAGLDPQAREFVQMHFERYDEDGDGFISLDENLKEPPLPPPAAERGGGFAGRRFADCSTCAQLSFGRSPRRALTAAWRRLMRSFRARASTRTAPSRRAAPVRLT